MKVDCLSYEGNKYPQEYYKLKEYCGPKLWQIIKEGMGMIAGGIIVRAFTGRRLYDIDIYFRAEKYLQDTLKEINKLPGHVIVETDNAVTLLIEEKKHP